MGAKKNSAWLAARADENERKNLFGYLYVVSGATPTGPLGSFLHEMPSEMAYPGLEGFKV